MMNDAFGGVSDGGELQNNNIINSEQCMMMTHVNSRVLGLPSHAMMVHSRHANKAHSATLVSSVHREHR